MLHYLEVRCRKLRSKGVNVDFMPIEKIIREKPAIIISQSANMSHWPTSNQTIGAMISSAEAVNRFFAGDKGLLLMHVPSHPASNLGPLSARHSVEFCWQM